jgi:Domain of unknown function (DUF4112)
MDQANTRARRSTGQRPDGRRTERVLAAERRIGHVAHLLDDLVELPGGMRVGLDPLIGLIPVVGDLTTAAVGAWIVLEATRFRIPGIVIARMVINTLVDFLVGLVPVIGDLLDFGFKGNRRNLELFHTHATDPGAHTGGSAAFVGGVALVFVGVLWIAWTLLAQLLGTVVG